MGRRDGYDAPKPIGPARPPRNPAARTSPAPPPKNNSAAPGSQQSGAGTSQGGQDEQHAQGAEDKKAPSKQGKQDGLGSGQA